MSTYHCLAARCRFVETYHKWAKPSVTNPIGITTTEARATTVQPTLVTARKA